MAAASVSLLSEGASRSVARVVVGALAGVAFVWATRRVLGHQEHLALGNLRGADALKALLIVSVMTAHSVAEGIGVGSAFGDSDRLGLVIALAIAVHNIPEGLAISLVLVPRGTSVRAAAGWSVFSSLPQPLLAVPAFLFVEAFAGLLPVGLGFAAGAMLWMVGRELVPEALTQERVPRLALVGTASFAVMLAFQLALL